jgi:uncharacterized protein involved in response to NO
MSHVIFQKGFRPFFLLGGILGGCLIPWWVHSYDEAMTGEPGLEGISWHSHEMIFGFTAAIIAGFLLTAVENWTGRPTARGPLLAALVALWAIGRMVSFGGITAAIAGLAELSFLVALAIVLAIPLLLERSRRNYLLLAALPVLWLCDVHHHLLASGLLPQSPIRSDLVAVDLIVLIMIIITGRIVPLFTRNALEDQRIRSHRGLDIAAIVGAVVVAVVELLVPSGYSMAAVAGVTGSLVLLRSAHWGAPRTVGRPILWVLHLGHAWIGFGLLLKAAAAAFPGVPASAATHALTAGAIGTLTLGMMARVTLGHTGRQLEVSSVVTVAFFAMTAGAVLRVFGPWFGPGLTRNFLMVSAGCWALAFALYLIVNARYLVTPRPDGKPG